MRTAARAAFIAVLQFTLLFAGRTTLAQVPQPQPIFGGRGDPTQRGDQDSISGVYLPTDRTLSRAVARARQRLSDREYQEALGFLHGLLTRDEDSFIERTGDDRDQRGLKASARKMIGDLPPAGLDAYELLQGPAARRQLEAALKDGDRDAVAKVVRQFFHTAAGYEATFVLAQLEADQGHRLAAAQLFQDLIDTPRASAQFEPQLSLAAAVNQLAAGRSEDAAATIRSLIQRSPSAEVSFYGKKTTLPGTSVDPLTWLTKFVGEIKVVSPTAGNWLTPRGDATRNLESPGGKPHLRPRWEARVVNEPAIESYLIGRTNDFLQRNVVAIPGARPIAVGEVVVMRTPNNVVAVDWQTGKRIWETRDEQELDAEDTSADLASGVDTDQVAAEGKPLEERMWDDALASGITSDGARVFVIRGLSMGRQEEVFPWQFNPGIGRVGAEPPASTNELTAYDLTTQGKLAWQLDGARANGPLAGAFFLGPPLAIDNTLFVMAEIRSALYLLALEPATGRLEWKQQLVGLEQGIMADPSRRRIGATPSYAGGILVCPTGASAIVAIDVVKREFAWVYRYPREAQAAADARQLWQQQQLQGQLGRVNDQWLDGTAIIADNRVLITPPESAEMHCLDLPTGKQEWKRRKGESLFVGGVHNGIALLIGGTSVQGVRLSDGAPAWKQETTTLPSGALPSGQGYLSDGKYFLPLTSGQIAVVDMANGSIANDSPPSDASLGNLICYRGSIISQSPLVLDKFEQLDVLQKRTEAALAQNPDDSAALRELAEIKSAAGSSEAAVQLLKRALELSPDDVAIQEMLVDQLLRRLSTDYPANRADVPLVAKLARGRDQQIDLMRINAEGLDKLGEKAAAWDAYLRLADFTSEAPTYLQIDDRYTVRSDRWVAAHVASIWTDSDSNAGIQKQLAEKLATRRPAVSNLQTAAELRHYLSHLGSLPGTDAVRIALAKFLIDRGRAQEAEIELLQLSKSREAEDRSAALELLAKIDAIPNQRVRTTEIAWPRGQVEATLQAGNGEQIRERTNRMPMERQGGGAYRQLRIEQDFNPAESPVQWLVAIDCSEIVGRNLLGDDVFRLAIDQSDLPRHNRDSAFVHGSRLGHFLYVSVGGQVIAVDSREDLAGAENQLLWLTNGSTDLSLESVRPRRALASPPPRSSRPPVYHPYSGRRRIAGSVGNSGGSLGPVTPRGVVLQDSDELRCVDPISGALLWARSDIPSGCELFGDEEFVFAADVGNRLAYVVRIVDGQLVEKRELPKAEWLLTAGRNLAQLGFGMNEGNRAMQIKVTDAWSQKTVYEGNFHIGSRISVMEPNSIAIFEPSGEFHVLDVSTGKLLIDEKLDAVSDLQSIHTLTAEDQLFLFVTAQAQPQFKPIGHPVDFPLVNGFAYAFSIESGKSIWPTPAVLRNRGVVLQQPQEIPFLVFVERQMTREAKGGGSQLRVLCIDKRTGQTVYRNDNVPDTSVVRIRGEAGPTPAVALEMGNGKIHLAMTDRPRPPQPPSNDDLEAPRETVERGLKALGQRWGNALRDALEKPNGVPGQQPLQPRPQPQVPNNAPPQNALPPVEQGVPETDDD